MGICRLLRLLRAATVAVGSSAGVALPCTAETAGRYPSQPLHMIVPFAPGGGADVVARITGDGLARRLGQPVVIDNRPGANGNIGMEFVARSPADGYTLILATSGTWAVNPSIYKSSFDVLKDFAPIMQVSSSPGVLVVHPSLPVHSVQELIDYATAHPGELNYGSAGIGGFGHVSAVMFSLMSGTQMTHIPYKGAGPATAAAIADEVQVLFNDALATMPYVTAGNLRAIAVTSKARMPLLPDKPAIDESGLQGFDNSAWTGVAAPAGTPRPIIDKLNRELTTVLDSPAIRQKIAATGAEVIGGTPAQFAEYLRTEIVKFERIVREGHLMR